MELDRCNMSEECCTPRSQMLPDPLLNPPQAPRKARFAADWGPRTTEDSKLLKRYFEELESTVTSTASQNTLSGMFEWTASSDCPCTISQRPMLLNTQQLGPRLKDLRIRTVVSADDGDILCLKRKAHALNDCIGSAEHLMDPSLMDADDELDHCTNSGKRATEEQKSSPKRQRLSQQQLLPLWARTEGLTNKTSHEGKHGLPSPDAPVTPRRGNSAYGIVRSTVACSSLLQLSDHSKAS